MIRSIAPVRRRPDLDWAEFSRHWREEHAAIAQHLRGMTRYVQGHAHPEDRPKGSPDDWLYDGVPFASFPDLAAIDDMRQDPGYLTHAVPDEAAFLDRSAMSAVLLTDSFGAPPAECGPAMRTLLVFARPAGADEATGRALAEAVEAHAAVRPVAHRWSTALDADPGLSPVSSSDRPFDGLLEMWFEAADEATRVAGAIAHDPGSLPVAVFCLVVRENVVIAG